MFVVDLVCPDGHLFEGWYDSKGAFDDARAAGDVACPVCGDVHVEQRPSFKGIVSRAPTTPAPTTTPTAPTPPAPQLPLEVQKALSQLIKLVKAHSEDAGDRFATRALAMHKGDEEPAPIHGTSTPEERERLVEEGVPFLGIPVPEIDEN